MKTQRKKDNCAVTPTRLWSFGPPKKCKEKRKKENEKQNKQNKKRGRNKVDLRPKKKTRKIQPLPIVDKGWRGFMNSSYYPQVGSQVGLGVLPQPPAFPQPGILLFWDHLFLARRRSFLLALGCAPHPSPHELNAGNHRCSSAQMDGGDVRSMAIVVGVLDGGRSLQRLH